MAEPARTYERDPRVDALEGDVCALLAARDHVNLLLKAL
jgi:hypothetical protein